MLFSGGFRGAPPACAPLWPKIFLISCSFLENLTKSYVGAPQRVGAPSYRESWIRPCYCLNFVFNIADKYSGQLGMNTRQCLSIPSPYIMSQPVTDPETELGVGQPTWTLYGCLRQPSFYDPIFQNQRGHAPFLLAPGSVTVQQSRDPVPIATQFFAINEKWLLVRSMK